MCWQNMTKRNHLLQRFPTLREVPATGFAPTPFAGVTSEKASSTARGVDAFDILGLFSSHWEVQSGEKLESRVNSQIKN